jgi:hypothetical protein
MKEAGGRRQEAGGRRQKAGGRRGTFLLGILEVIIHNLNLHDPIFSLTW